MNEKFEDIGLFILMAIFLVYVLSSGTLHEAAYSFFDDMKWLVNNF